MTFSTLATVKRQPESVSGQVQGGPARARGVLGKFPRHRWVLVNATLKTRELVQGPDEGTPMDLVRGRLLISLRKPQVMLSFGAHTRRTGSADMHARPKTITLGAVSEVSSREPRKE